MRKVLKWIGIALAVLVVLVVVVGAVLYFLGSNKLNKTYGDVQAEAITIPSGDAEAIARGQHLSEAVTLCSECHGDNLGGDELLDSAVIGTLYAPNLTSGQGGLGDFTDEDWVRAVRHGVGPDDKSLIGMPSQYLYYLSDADLGAILAYIQSVPPVDNEGPDSSLAIPGTILAALGMLGDLPADAIDHDTRPVAPEVGVTAEYGEYLANIGSCHDCHGDNLTGGPSMGPPPGPNLTQSGDLGGWSEQDFINTIRQGITPDGDTLDADDMPWDYYTRMTDDELKAIWMYLQTLEG
jgi:mono/diheme cytochrome c family protein